MFDLSFKAVYFMLSHTIIACKLIKLRELYIASLFWPKPVKKGQDMYPLIMPIRSWPC